MKFIERLQCKQTFLKVFTGGYWLFWVLSSLHFRVATTNRLCDRIYFNHGDETKMPYVQLEGIYHMDILFNGHPIYKHEQRDYYLEYLYSNEDSFMAFNVLDASKLRRSYMGLRALMKRNFKSPNWAPQITDSIQPFHKFILKWEYYDWQSQTHTSMTRDAVSLICVRDDVYRCSSQRVYLNTTFTSSQNGVVLHNHLGDYFEELTGGYNAYKNSRKIYRHSRNSEWLLYYERPYWKIRDCRSSFNRPILRAKDSSFRPEYITAFWQYLDGSWKNFSSSASIQCRGLLQHYRDGSVKSCQDSNPCLNGGTCVNSKSTNEIICHCGAPFTGLRCEKRQKRCSKYLYGSNSTNHVMIYGFEPSSFASVFCKEKYKPNYFLSQCISTGHSSSWSLRRGCYVSHPSALHLRASLDEQGTSFNFDHYPVPRLVLLAIVCILQVLVPCIHMIIGKCKGKSISRIVSIHAFISYICWWMYFLGCRVASCPTYGKVLPDLWIMSFVMIPLCYIYMLRESYCSEEIKYFSSMLENVSVVEFVERLKQTDPQMIMKIECYHWGKRTDSEFSEIVKVITYTEEKLFPIGYSQDVSDPEGPEFDPYGGTKLKLSLEIESGDEETMTKFSELRQQLISNNEYADRYITFKYSEDVNGFRKRICAYTNSKYRSWWMNSKLYWLSSIFGLTWIFRIIFNFNTTECKYTIKKLIYYTPTSTNIETTVSQLHGADTTAFSSSLQHIDTDQRSLNSETQFSNTATNQVSIPMQPLATPNEPLPNELPPSYDGVAPNEPLPTEPPPSYDEVVPNEL